MQPTTGSIVISKAGRDKGLPFVVLSTEEEYCFIANGKCRKIEHPKKKKLKHLQMTNKVLPERSFETNKQIRSQLSQIFKSEQSDEQNPA